MGSRCPGGAIPLQWVGAPREEKGTECERGGLGEALHRAGSGCQQRTLGGLERIEHTLCVSRRGFWAECLRSSGPGVAESEVEKALGDAEEAAPGDRGRGRGRGPSLWRVKRNTTCEGFRSRVRRMTGDGETKVTAERMRAATGGLSHGATQHFSDAREERQR